jgi:hypothetical protein
LGEIRLFPPNPLIRIPILNRDAYKKFSASEPNPEYISSSDEQTVF